MDYELDDQRDPDDVPDRVTLPSLGTGYVAAPAPGKRWGAAETTAASLISALALFIALRHALIPNLEFDAISLGALAVAELPWLARYLKRR
jgi:hypothetical protein